MKNDNVFWQFSCQAYEGYEAEFLRLQDESGLQINILLLCGFLGKQEQSIKNIEAMIGICEELDKRLVPLRNVRKQVKPMDKSLYESCKALELQFERHCQDSLLSAVLVGEGGSVESNIDLYLDFLSKKQKRCWSSSAICAMILHLQEVIHGSS